MDVGVKEKKVLWTKSKFGVRLVGWIVLIFTEMVNLRTEVGSWQRQEEKPSKKGYVQREYEEDDATVSTISGRRMVHYTYHKLSVTDADIHSALFVFITSCIT